MKNKENVYPFIAAMASLFLSSVIVLEIAGGVEGLFIKLPLIVSIEASLIVIIISFCVFIEIKTQILIKPQERKLSKESDLIDKRLNWLKNWADFFDKLSRQKRPRLN